MAVFFMIASVENTSLRGNLANIFSLIIVGIAVVITNVFTTKRKFNNLLSFLKKESNVFFECNDDTAYFDYQGASFTYMMVEKKATFFKKQKDYFRIFFDCMLPQESEQTAIAMTKEIKKILVKKTHIDFVVEVSKNGLQFYCNFSVPLDNPNVKQELLSIQDKLFWLTNAFHLSNTQRYVMYTDYLEDLDSLTEEEVMCYAFLQGKTVHEIFAVTANKIINLSQSDFYNIEGDDVIPISQQEFEKAKYTFR